MLASGHRLLARDTTSSYPKAVLALPDVGYMRALSSEGVLSVGPGLILPEEGGGPPEAFDVLRAANVEFVEISLGFDVAAIVKKVSVIGRALSVPDRAAALASDVATGFDLAVANAHAEPSNTNAETPKRVLFLLNARNGKFSAAGTETAADAIILLAGGVSAVQNLTGYNPLTNEAAVAAAPDVILMMERSGGSDLSAQELFETPSLTISPAAKNAALVKMDGLRLLGFGPRTADAIANLSQALGQF